MKILKEKYPLYIVSNCQSGYIESFLAYYHLEDYFSDMECFGNNGMQKGENIARLARRNHLDKAVYVGDIQGDYDASMQAGSDLSMRRMGLVPSISRCLKSIPLKNCRKFWQNCGDVNKGTHYMKKLAWKMANSMIQSD